MLLAKNLKHNSSFSRIQSTTSGEVRSGLQALAANGKIEPKVIGSLMNDLESSRGRVVNGVPQFEKIVTAAASIESKEVVNAIFTTARKCTGDWQKYPLPPNDAPAIIVSFSVSFSDEITYPSGVKKIPDANVVARDLRILANVVSTPHFRELKSDAERLKTLSEFLKASSKERQKTFGSW